MKNKRKRIAVKTKPQLVFSTAQKKIHVASTENKGYKAIVNN
jgi:hypothetical protein